MRTHCHPVYWVLRWLKVNSILKLHLSRTYAVPKWAKLKDENGTHAIGSFHTWTMKYGALDSFDHVAKYEQSRKCWNIHSFEMSHRYSYLFIYFMWIVYDVHSMLPVTHLFIAIANYTFSSHFQNTIYSQVSCYLLLNWVDLNLSQHAHSTEQIMMRKSAREWNERKRLLPIILCNKVLRMYWHSIHCFFFARAPMCRMAK